MAAEKVILSRRRQRTASCANFVNKSSAARSLGGSCSDYLRPQSAAVAMDRIDQHSDIFRGRVLRNSVTQIEDVTGPASIGIARCSK